ncbi:MAG: hypothetical protein AB7E79_08680 [Rhodospirillaceae bacterium]
MWRFLIPLMLMTAVSGCKEQTPPQHQAAEDADRWLNRELGWVEGADAPTRAAQDASLKQYRFLSVCSLGCGVVGVSDVAVRMCHPDVEVVVVDKTTEAVQSERHSDLKKRAKSFAEDYNRRMIDHLKSLGEGACPAPVDWPKANSEITAMLDRLYTGGFRGDVYVSDRRRAFQIRLPRGVAAADVRAPLCDIVARNGLKDRAGLEVKSVDAQEDYAQLTC